MYEDLAAVAALEAALDSLPDVKTITINVETHGAAGAAAAAAGAGAGGAGDTAGLAAEAEALRAAQEAADGAARSTAGLDAATTAEAVSAADAAKAEYLLAMADRMRANTARDAADSSSAAGAAAAASGTAAAGAGRGWGVLTRDFTLWAGAFGSTALIGSVKGWHVALDGVLEASIALGEALMALSVGLASMVPAAQDIYTHLKSVQTVNSALGSSIPPLTGKFDALAQAMAPQTVEAFGGALNLVNANSNALARVAREVVMGLDDWIAKLDIWKASQAGMGGILQNGVGFLHQFEQVVNNVGGAIATLIRADPGTAHFLMDFVVGVSKAAAVLLQFLGPALPFLLALHSIDLWGGLAVSRVVALGTSMSGMVQSAATAAAKLGLFGDAGRAAIIPMNDLRTAEAGAALETGALEKSFLGLSTLSWVGLAALAAALAYAGYESTQADASVKKFVTDTTNNINSLPASQAITGIAVAVGQLNTQISKVSTAQISQEWNSLGHTFASVGMDTRAFVSDYTTGMKQLTSGHIISGVVNLGNAVKGIFVPGQGEAIQATNNINAYKGAIVKLTGEQANLFKVTGQVMTGQIDATHATYSYQQALAILDLAGVQAGDSFALMKQKVSNLITGYQNMGVQGGMLSNSVNAVTFASEQQSSKISQLTQSWSSFISMVTGSQSAFITAEQGIYGMATAASGSSAALTVSNGKTSLVTKATASLGSAATSTAVNIDGLSQNSLQLAATFQSAITNGSSLINSMLTQSSAAGLGAQGYQMITQGAKDYLQQILPMAKGSQTLTSEIYALAQQAGYQGANSFQSLAKWIGNTANPAQNLQGIIAKLTGASAGLTNDMNNLANAISGNLNQAMAAAIFQATGGQKAFDTFATSALKAHGNTDLMKNSATTLARELVTTTGNTNSAHQMFDTFAISLGLSKKQADTLWGSVANNLNPALGHAKSAAQGAGSAAQTAGNQMNTAAGQAKYYAGELDGIPQYIHTTVSISTLYSGTPFGGSGGILPTPTGHASGYRVPGYGGGDKHLALLEGGEAVVPKELTGGVAGYLKANGVPGFESGGFVPWHSSVGTGGDGGYQSGGSEVPVHVHLHGDLADQALFQRLKVQTSRYGIRNTGQTTGKLLPSRPR